jgi:hypothetical protein
MINSFLFLALVVSFMMMCMMDMFTHIPVRSARVRQRDT